MQPTQKRYGATPAAGESAEGSAQGHAPGHASRSAARYGPVQAKRGPLQRYGGNASTGDALGAPTGSGQTLPAPLQNKMEGAFGTDFSDVRVHADSAQPQQVGALAFTRGSDVAFAPGMYSPDTPAGQELIGHELTHVVQQASGRVADPAAGESPVNDDPGLEHDADQLGARAAHGESVTVPGSSRDEGVQRLADPAVQAKRGPIQAWNPFRGPKNRTRSAVKGVGKGLINAVFPVFSWKDFFENIESGWSKSENPLLGKSAAKNFGIRSLVLLKELGQLTAALATVAATIFGIASIFAPYVAPIGALCGLIATIAHAVTFVLRSIYLAFVGGKLHSLANARDPQEIEAKKKLEAQKWSEIGGLLGNGIGVIFGGFGGAFGSSPHSMVGDASSAWAGQTVNSTSQAGTLGAALPSTWSDGGKNAMSTFFGQMGNSSADAVGGGSTRHGKMTSGRIQGPPQLPQQPQQQHDEDDSSESSELSDDDIQQAQQVAEQVLQLNQHAQNPQVQPPRQDEIGQANANLEELTGHAQQANAPVQQIEQAEVTDTKEVSEADAQDADARLSAHGEADESGGGPPEVTVTPPEEEDTSQQQQPQDSSHLRAPQTGAPRRDARPRPAPPQITVTPPEEEGTHHHEEHAQDSNLLQAPQQQQQTDARPPMQQGVVQQKRGANSGGRKPVQAKLGSWFKRKVVNRIKKAVRKAKAKLMAKVYQLLGLDKKSAEAKQQLAQLSAKSDGARAAEAEKKAAAADAAKKAEELKKRAS